MICLVFLFFSDIMEVAFLQKKYAQVLFVIKEKAEHIKVAKNSLIKARACICL